MIRYQDVFDETYGHYYAEAIEYGVEWTERHDKFVEDAASDLCRYLEDTKSNWYNVEAPELPGLAEATKENTMFDDLINHVGHDLECVTYGTDEPVNVAVECITCGCVIFDYDKENNNE